MTNSAFYFQELVISRNLMQKTTWEGLKNSECFEEKDEKIGKLITKFKKKNDLCNTLEQ